MAAPTIPLAGQHDTTDHHIVRGAPLTVMRIAWGLLIAGALLTYFTSIPARLDLVSEAAPVIVSVMGDMGISLRGVAILSVVLEIIQVLVFSGVSLLLFIRRSDNWYTMLTSVMLISFGVVTLSFFGIDTGVAWSLSYMLVFFQVLGYILFGVFVFTFPDGRFYAWWGRVLVIGWVLLLISQLLLPGLIPSFNVWTDNPIPIIYQIAFFSASVFAGVMKFNHHPRGSLMHQQSKWVISSLLLAFVGFLFQSVPVLLFPSLLEMNAAGLLYEIGNNLITVFTLSLLPVGIAFSILRYRLWDVDFVINRGVVYAAVTVLTIVLTVVDLLLVNALITVITGREEATIALVIAAVISGIVFMPMQRFMQGWVDRNLYGIRVQYRRIRRQPTSPEDGEIADEGETLGGYRVGDLIGRGGMAEVYRGEHPTLGLPVAIKVLPASLADQEDFQARFEREARTVAALRHSNIIQLYDFGVEDDRSYMVMEYVDGGTLADRLREESRLSLPATIEIVTDLAAALDYAHGQGVVHRDVKPSNVLLERLRGGQRSHRAVLMDFGIARIAGAGTRLTHTGMMGTLDYIAPEQIRASKDVDGRADLYSLGVMTFQMLTGQLPFHSDNPGALVLAHLQQPPPDPRLLAPDLPQGISEIIAHAMAKEVDQRFRSGAELAHALAALEE